MLLIAIAINAAATNIDNTIIDKKLNIDDYIQKQ